MIWQIFGFVFVVIAGVLLHFIYEWTNNCIIVAPFSAVNESIWEHMKLLFFSLFIFAIIEFYFIGNKFINFWFAKLNCIFTGFILIPIIYYTYTGALGVNADWFNIFIFFIAAALSFFVEYLIILNRFDYLNSEIISFVFLCLIALLFIIMTFVQPEIPLFQDMRTGKYGYK